MEQLHKKENSNRKQNPYFYFFYNPEQIDFFIKNGIIPIGAGKGTMGDVYIKFPKNTESKIIFDRWCILCEQVRR